MDNKEELSWRKKAVKLYLKGMRPTEILKQVPRSRVWLLRWTKRFEEEGWRGLLNRPTQPHHSPQADDSRARKVVERVRRALERRQVGLIGARAVPQEITSHRLLNPPPALSTIKRWLTAAGLIKSEAPPPERLSDPAPPLTDGVVRHLMDWTARYLTGGEKLFVFHTIDARTHALAETFSHDKSTQSLRRHALQVWQTLGLPHSLQLDNDTASTGGEKTPRRFSSFVRLCLYLGIELIFIPPAEPKRNSLVEGIHALWAKSFWDRLRFRSFKEALKKSGKFLSWYMNEYRPPALSGLAPAEASRRVGRQRLTSAQIKQIPEKLPITAGQVHFIRKVNAAGEISFLGENWKVGKRLAHRYVKATVTTHRQRLAIYYQRSASSQPRLVKGASDEIAETVRRLRPEYHR